MGMAEMVGSIGLTLFCNKCVELFYEFKQDGNLTDELSETCKHAIAAFRSFRLPNGEDVAGDSGERIALFNTNEEVRSFEQALGGSEKVNDDTLNKWIGKMEVLLDKSASLDNRKQTADDLRQFFDTLGDYSFYASREALRSSETMARI